LQERAKSQVSVLENEWRETWYPESLVSMCVKWCVLLVDYACVSGATMSVVSLEGCPASPFIAARGGRAFTYVSL
jgi:hypothetical protein